MVHLLLYLFVWILLLIMKYYGTQKEIKKTFETCKIRGTYS